jgi:REP element-mobilizing transposase RayT
LGRPLRMYQERGMYFVTARTTQARLLLRPSERVNETIGGVLARTLHLTGVRLHAFAFASNHLHLLVTAEGATLSHFMQHLLGNIARRVGRLVDWTGGFWHRRFSCEAVLDDAAAEGRLEYILAHGVKEGLVSKVQDWPGLSCLPELLADLSKTPRFFGWKSSSKPTCSQPHDGRFALALSPLPSWDCLSPERRRRNVRAMIRRIEAAGAVRQKPPLGRVAILNQEPHSRPQHASARPRPHCHASLATLKSMFLQRYRAFTCAYRAASNRYRQGQWATEFPEFSFRPPVQFRLQFFSTDSPTSVRPSDETQLENDQLVRSFPLSREHPTGSSSLECQTPRTISNHRLSSEA